MVRFIPLTCKTSTHLQITNAVQKIKAQQIKWLPLLCAPQNGNITVYKIDFFLRSVNNSDGVTDKPTQVCM